MVERASTLPPLAHGVAGVFKFWVILASKSPCPAIYRKLAFLISEPDEMTPRLPTPAEIRVKTLYIYKIPKSVKASNCKEFSIFAHSAHFGLDGEKSPKLLSFNISVSYDVYKGKFTIMCIMINRT